MDNEKTVLPQGDSEMQDNKLNRAQRKFTYANRKERRRMAKRNKLFKHKGGWGAANDQAKMVRQKQGELILQKIEEGELEDTK